MSAAVPPLVELRQIRKEFGGVSANDGIDLDLRAGELHGLLGENGAGKSTLMSVLVGLYRPDAGEIRVQGRPVRLGSPKDAVRLGIGMVHQHFLQSERHGALDNILLGQPRLPWLLRRTAFRQQVQQLATRYGLEVELERDEPLGLRPVGERQKVELLRVLCQGARILVLDEPTAVLSRSETVALFRMLRVFCAEGGGVIFISHKLDEVLELADRVTVLRRGRHCGTLPVAGLDAATLAERMVGRELVLRQRAGGPAVKQAGPPVVRLHEVTVRGPEPGRPRLGGVSLQVHPGEILGIAGVAGSGQGALAEVLTGLTPPTQGVVELAGRAMQGQGPAAFRAAGVVHIPEDRLRTGLAPSLTLTENLILTRAHRFSRHGWLRWSAATAWAASRLEQQAVQCPGPRARTAVLSGGNLQKVILARELAGLPEGTIRLVVAVYPCRGLDVGAAEAVRGELLAAAAQGAAVVLCSEELDELFRLADRIGVLFRGRLLDVQPVERLTRQQVGLLLGGQEAGACG